MVHSSPRLVPFKRETVPTGITLTKPVCKSPLGPWQAPITVFSPVIVSNQSSVYGGSVSGLVGLSSGRSTGNLSASIVGGVFSRQPNRPSITYGLALQPPNIKGTENAGALHWLGLDSSAYTGDITWKTTTVTSNSDVALFAIDGWQFKTGGTTVINSNQDLSSTIDPYYVNMFFPSQEAQLIRKSIHHHPHILINQPIFLQTPPSKGHPPNRPTMVNPPYTSFRATPSCPSPLLSGDKLGR